MDKKAKKKTGLVFLDPKPKEEALKSQPKDVLEILVERWHAKHPREDYHRLPEHLGMNEAEFAVWNANHHDVPDRFEGKYYCKDCGARAQVTPTTCLGPFHHYKV